MIVGIVGSEEIKFTPETKDRAWGVILDILSEPDVTGVCSGGCHLGGIDIWAEEIGRVLELELFIFKPRTQSWNEGYKPRNIEIAHKSDVVHCITVKELPDTYKGMRFPLCYHCGTADHVKSGGCWTAKFAQGLGKKAVWHII